MYKFGSSLGKIPIPLVFALATVVGVYTSFVININVLDVTHWPVSWDPRYATYNITHLYQTAPMIGTPYKTLILGYGTAQFRNPTNVYYLHRVHSGGRDGDLGGYLPTVLIIESGSLPTNTYIEWTCPVSNHVRKLYFVANSHRAYVIGPYHYDGMYSVAIIPVYYRVNGNNVFIYPMERPAVNINEMCSVIYGAGYPNANFRDAFFVLGDSSFFDCLDYSFFDSPNRLGWVRIASSATSAPLNPSPTHYRVTVNVNNNRITIVLAYWYAVDRDPGYFVVRPN